MRNHFITDLGLTRATLLGEAPEGPIIFIEFMLEHFGSPDGYTSHQTHFHLSEEEWHAAQVDVLMTCIISYLYMPVYMDHLHIGVIIAVCGLRQGHTILPMILSEAFISMSYCQTFEGHDFRDSSILLYIWCMPYIGPIGSFRPRAFALVMISLLSLHFVQPLMSMDCLGQSSSHLLRTLTHWFYTLAFIQI